MSASPLLSTPARVTVPSSTGEASVLLELRYRPLGDVLLGEVAAVSAEGASRTEAIDADVDLRWVDSGSGETLTAFRVVHARSRWDRDPAGLPLGSILDLDRFFARADRVAGDSLASRARAVVTSRVVVPCGRLDRGAIATGNVGELPSSLDLVRSVLLLADAIEHAARLADRHDAVRTVRLLHALRELADVLRRLPGRPAPGATIGALRLVSGGLPLTTAERIAVRTLLDRSLDPTDWAEVSAELCLLATGIAPWVSAPSPSTS